MQTQGDNQGRGLIGYSACSYSVRGCVILLSENPRSPAMAFDVTKNSIGLSLLDAASATRYGHEPAAKVHSALLLAAASTLAPCWPCLRRRRQVLSVLSCVRIFVAQHAGASGGVGGSWSSSRPLPSGVPDDDASSVLGAILPSQPPNAAGAIRAAPSVGEEVS